MLLVIEIKTDLVDIQSLLGSLDVKTRLARHVAEPFGWAVRTVIPAIVFAEDRTIRRRLAKLDTLFDRFSVRGRACNSWLRRPSGACNGLLWFVSMPARVADSGGRRVRVRGAAAGRRAS